MSFPENPNAVWAANGEFSMSAERARELAWIATGGQTGIVGPESLQVQAQPTPDGTVRVLPGGFAMAATPEHLTMQTGYTSAPWQSYMRAVYQTQTVPISPTGSSGGRVDTIGIVVDDPQYEGTTDSVDWENHQFWRFHVIENASVGSTRPHHFGALGRPFMPLAQVNIPASTATITNSMIRDLRFLAVEREKTVTFLEPANETGSTLTLTSSQDGWYSFPEIGNITVPQWATHMVLEGSLTSFRVTGSGMASGSARLQFTADTGWQSLPETSWREDGSFSQSNLHVAGRLALDYDARNTGRAGRVRLQVRRYGGSANFTVPAHLTTTSWVKGSVVFQEAPRSSS